MSNTVIEFSGVTKIYSIQERGFRSFRDSFSRAVDKVILRVVGKNRNEVLSSNSDKIYALDNVSFSVGKEEVLGIIGANGSGKTTILRLLANVAHPTYGEVSVTGKVAPLIQVGAGFHPELTGCENVYLNATILGLKKKEIDSIYDDIVSFAELEKFMDTPVKRYSSGMYVRLGFAVAININPDILLIDEILAVGDISFRKKCLEMMGNIRKSEKTIVFVSHQLSSVKEMCDRVIWLDKGKIREEGDASDVINAYTSYMTSKSQHISDLTYTGGQSRWGTGEARFTNIQILNSNGEHRKNFIAGDEITIQLEYRAYERINSPIFRINILNSDEIVLFSSHYSKDRVGRYSIENRGILECALDTISMRPGTYYITVDLVVELDNLSFDRIGRAASFMIKRGTGKGFDKYESYSNDGVTNMPHEWRVVD